MNPDSPQSSREELEARLTALLLGELPVAEAAAMRRAIEQDAELAQLYERLKTTIDLVREASAGPITQAGTQPTPLKLSAENRQRLLQRFKTVAPKELAAAPPRELPWFVPMSIAAALVALIGSVALLPDFVNRSARAKTYARRAALSSAASVDDSVRAGELSPDNGRVAVQPAWRTESPQESAQGREDLKQQGLRLPTLTALPPSKDVNSVGLQRDQGESVVNTLTVSAIPPAVPGVGGIVLPSDSANAPEANVIKGVASKPGPAASSYTFGGLGGGAGGGIGGGGTHIVTTTPPPEANLTVTATSSDNGRIVPDSRPQAIFPQQQKDNNLAKDKREISKVAESAIASSNRLTGRHAFLGPVVGGKPLGELEVPKPMAVAGTTLGTSIETVLATAGVAPTTGTPLPASDQSLRLNESDSKQNANADGALALGDVPRFENLFQTKNFLANAEFSPDGATGKVGLQGGTLAAWYMNGVSLSSPTLLNPRGGTAQVAAGNEYGRVSPQVNSEPHRDSVIQDSVIQFSGLGLAASSAPNVVFDVDGGVLQDLPRGLTASLAQGQQGAQLDLNFIHASPSPSRDPFRQKEDKLSWIDKAIPANRGEQNPAALKMEPQLMRRYGLMRPGLEESKSKAVTTDGEKPQSIRQSIVLPQELSDGAENRPLRESDRSAKGIAALEKVPALQEKKRELERLVELRDNISARANAEKTDIALPQSSLVRIVDLAEVEPKKNPSPVEPLQRMAIDGIEKVARIQVGKDAANIAPTLLGVQSPNAYDPYFLQSEFEKIKSKAVLSKVIEKLNLNEAWGRKKGAGEKLKDQEAVTLLLNNLDVRQVPNSDLIDIRVKSDRPEEAARIANTIAEVYRDSREDRRRKAGAEVLSVLDHQVAEQEEKIARTQQEVEQLQRDLSSQPTDTAPPKPIAPALIPQPEIETRENAFSTFSLNISDVSFKLAAASLEKGVMPEPATVRSEEFINAFDYRDSEPPPDVPIAFAWERALYPFAHNRDLLRFSIKTAAEGRQPGRPLNLILLLDNSGSMERADRVRIVREALRVLAGQLQPQDKLSVIAFARTARLWADGVAGNQAGQVVEHVSNLTPQGGTNLEEAMNLAYQTALRHYVQGGVNRVVLLTDGAANLGNVSPAALKQKVETHRKQGIALDCFGIGWEGYNDDLLEVLSRNGDGRYGFINTPEEASTRFAGKLAGALHVAASDVKVQVEFNPKRVTAYRQIGYAKHQLTQEQFRDNTVDAAEIGTAESGNALYVVEVNPRGEGLLAIVRVRYKVPGTAEYREQEWVVPYTGSAVALDQASSAMRLAATASAFSEWLVSSPYAAEITPDRLLAYLNRVPEAYGVDPRPKQLESMIRQAKSVVGR